MNLFLADFNFLKSLCVASEGPLDSLTLLSKPVWSAAADAAKEWMNEWRAAESAWGPCSLQSKLASFTVLQPLALLHCVPRNKGRESSSTTRKESIDRVSLERPSFPWFFFEWGLILCRLLLWSENSYIDQLLEKKLVKTMQWKNGDGEASVVGVGPFDSLRGAASLSYRTSDTSFTNQCPAKQRKSDQHLTMEVQPCYFGVDQNTHKDKW